MTGKGEKQPRLTVPADRVSTQRQVDVATQSSGGDRKSCFDNDAESIVGENVVVGNDTRRSSYVRGQHTNGADTEADSDRNSLEVSNFVVRHRHSDE